jgi:hypothetical protein
MEDMMPNKYEPEADTLIPPVTYEDCRDTWRNLRKIVFAELDGQHVLGNPEFDNAAAVDLSERFEQDAELREIVAEVLLACTMRIELGRKCKPLLKNYAPEIKNLLVYGANLFLEFLELRAAVQKGVVVSRGSWEDAWIHLFVEFRDELIGKSNVRWWKRQQFRYGAWQ